jgi:membrane protein DedA with SNARE-associated domain
MEAFIVKIITDYLLFGVFGLLLACGLGVPMPEDIILVTAGYIAYLYPANVNLVSLVLVSMAGVLVGDSLIFLIGRRLGPRAMNLPLFKRILTPARLEKMKGYFSSYGNKIIFVGRFMAGIRAPLFMSAGISGHPYWRFILYDSLAAAISVPVWVLLANHFGEEIDQLKFMLIKTQRALFIIIPLAIAIWLVFRKFVKKSEEEIPNEYGEELPGSRGRPPEPPEKSEPPDG